ncbi:hypothetical protein [Martelella soudanensis]
MSKDHDMSDGQRLHKVINIDIEGSGESLYGRYGAICLAVFDIRQIGLGNASLFCQRLHGQAPVFAPHAQAALGFIGKRDNQFVWVGFFSGVHAGHDRAGVQAVEHIIVIGFAQKHVIIAFNGDFLDFAHGVSLLVNAAARTCIDDHDNQTLIIKNDAVGTDADAKIGAALQLLQIDSFTRRESLDLGNDCIAALWLHALNALHRDLGVTDRLHALNIAICDILRKIENVFSYIFRLGAMEVLP